MNPKSSKKLPIHENADANITCDFGDGDISRSRSFLSNTCTTRANGRRRHDGRRHDRRQSRGLLKFNSRYIIYTHIYTYTYMCQGVIYILYIYINIYDTLTHPITCGQTVENSQLNFYIFYLSTSSLRSARVECGDRMD